MKFLKNWTIEVSKIPKYSAFGGEFVMDLDYNLLSVISESDEEVFTEDRKALLLPILKQMAGKDTLTVKHKQRYGLGRFYADQSISPIAVSRHIKHTLFHAIDWIDLDMVKGHPSILCSVAALNNVEVPAFTEYLKDPEQIFKTLIEYYSVDEDNILTEENVKDIFNISIYGGKVDTWIFQMSQIGKIVKQKPHSFVINFIREAQTIIDIVFAANKEIVARVQGSLTDEDAIKKRVMSYWCGVLENEVIHVCYKLLMKRQVVEKRRNVALEYDGLCFKKPSKFDSETADELVGAMNDAILKETGLNVKMKFKGYKAEHVNKRVIDLAREYVPSDDISEIEDIEKKDDGLLLFETEFDIANDLYDGLSKNIVYTRGMIFYKDGHTWTNDPRTLHDNLLIYIMKKPYWYANEVFNTKTKEYVMRKDRPANKTKKGAESLLSLLLTIVRQKADNNFYDKFITTTKHKIAFNDGVLDVKQKTFTEWKDVSDFYSTLKINRNFKHVFDCQEFYAPCCDEIKNKIMSRLFEDKTDSALLFFARGLAGCFEDKSYSMFMGNRNSGKGVLHQLTTTALEGYYSSFDANNLLYERSSGEDKAKKMYWMLDLQFKRIVISQEIKTELKSSVKLDGVLLKKLASGGDVLSARRNFDIYMTEFIITASIMMMFNDMPPVEPADALETCYQYTSTTQFVTQEELNAKSETNSDPLYLKKYLVRDDSIKTKCKSVEWGDAYILLLMNSFKDQPTPHAPPVDDSENMDLSFKIFESFSFDDRNSFTSFADIKKWMDVEGVNATLKKVKTELIGLGVKNHKTVGVRGFKGLALKATDQCSADDCTTVI